MRICNEALKAGGFPEVFFLLNDGGNELGAAVGGRPAHPAGQLHRLHRRRPPGGRARGAAHGPLRCWSWAATTPSSWTDTADLKLAIPAIVFGAVGTAGQRCTTTRRLIVHESICDDVAGQARRGLQAGRDAHRRPARARHPHGPAHRRGGRAALRSPRSRKAQGRRRQGRDRRQRRSSGPGNFVLPTIITGAGQRRRGRADRDLRADPLRHAVPRRWTRRSRCRTACRRACRRPIFTPGPARRPSSSSSAAGSDCGIANVNIGTSRRGDRRRLRRREGDRRRSRVRLGCVEGLHAPADQHDQLLRRAAAGAGHQVRSLSAPSDRTVEGKDRPPILLSPTAGTTASDEVK